MHSSDTLQRIQEKITAALSPVHLEIRDDSALHAGHAGARSGGGHFAVTVVSAAFEGKSATERHRLVYRVLQEEMRGPIHALSVTAIGPSEWGGPPSPTTGAR